MGRIIFFLALVLSSALAAQLRIAEMANDFDSPGTDYQKVPLQLPAANVHAVRSVGDATADLTCFSIDRSQFPNVPATQALELDKAKLCVVDKFSRCESVKMIESDSGDFCVAGLSQEVARLKKMLPVSGRRWPELSKAGLHLMKDSAGGQAVRLHVKFDWIDAPVDVETEAFAIFDLEKPAPILSARDDDDDDDEDDEDVVVTDEIPNWLWIVFIVVVAVTAICVILAAFAYPHHGGALHPAVIRTR